MNAERQCQTALRCLNAICSIRIQVDKDISEVFLHGLNELPQTNQGQGRTQYQGDTKLNHQVKWKKELYNLNDHWDHYAK